VLELLWTATAASLLVCLCFALALRALDDALAGRDARRPAATVCHAIMAAVPATICVGAIAAAVLVLVG
jgi:hypothetical protein